MHPATLQKLLRNGPSRMILIDSEHSLDMLEPVQFQEPPRDTAGFPVSMPQGGQSLIQSKVGPPWIGLDLGCPTDAQSDCDLGEFGGTFAMWVGGGAVYTKY